MKPLGIHIAPLMGFANTLTSPAAMRPFNEIFIPSKAATLYTDGFSSFLKYVDQDFVLC